MAIDDWEKRTREASFRWVLGVGLAIAVASALAVASVHQRADARRRDQLAAAAIEQLAQQLRQEELKPDLNFRESEEAMAAWRSLQVALAGLKETAPGAAGVREAGRAYLEAADRYLRLERMGLWGEAWGAGQQSERAYRQLLDQARRASAACGAETSRALHLADVGSTLAIAAEALLIGVLTLASERSRRAHVLRLAAEKARQEARFRSFVQGSSDVTAVLDTDRRIRYLSPAVFHVLGYPPEGRLGEDGFANLHPEDLAKARDTFARVLAEPGKPLLIEARLRHADGSWRWVEISSANLLADPNVAGVVLNIRDVSERKGLEELLRHQALHDSLTGLANRALLGTLLTRALAAAERRRRQVTLFYIDLDDFKRVNDTLGHEAGDQLLVQVAQRLRAGVRTEDTPARLGGDELAVLAEGMSPQEAVDFAQRLLSDLGEPYVLGGKTVGVGASLGIAQSAPGDGAEELLRHADLAMYTAKTSGKGHLAFFEGTMLQRKKSWATPSRRRKHSTAAA